MKIKLKLNYDLGRLGYEEVLTTGAACRQCRVLTSSKLRKRAVFHSPELPPGRTFISASAVSHREFAKRGFVNG